MNINRFFNQRRLSSAMVLQGIAFDLPHLRSFFHRVKQVTGGGAVATITLITS
jgi:hypothetical protein